VKDEKNVALHLPDDSLADPAQCLHPGARGGAERRIVGLEKRRRAIADPLQRLAADPALERLDVDRDFG
jgi:hypothetical protein